MRILAFETSAKTAGVALVEDGKLIGEYLQNSGQTHSRTLMKMAVDLLNNCDLKPENVDAVACAAGPGSFTGIRIGVSAAKGFAWGANIPCVGVSTLEGMVRSIAVTDGIYCAVMDARRSQVYTAMFRLEHGSLHRLTDDAAISLDELRNLLEKTEKDKILVGDGAAMCYNELQDHVSGLILMPEHLRMQRASGTALAAWLRLSAGERPDGGILVPNYLRLSQAERERMNKEKVE